MNPEQIIKRFDVARGDRQRFEPLFDDAIRLTMPGRARFNSRNPVDDGLDIFDETGANAVAEFVSRMQAGISPPFTNFLKLEASASVEAKDRDAVNRDLQEIEDFMFEEIWASNFAQESAEAYNDLCISTGCMLVEEQQGDTAFTNRAIPITEFFIERGPDDRIGGIYRRRKMKAELIPVLYRNAQIENTSTGKEVLEQKDKTLDVLEYTWRDWMQAVETYEHRVIVVDHKEEIVRRTLKGTGSSPFIGFRWSTAPGEAWGRGPLLNAMGGIRTTNMMVELVLENAAMAVVGMYQTDNDGVVNSDNVQLLPGSIITKEMGTVGLEPINGAGGNFNMRDVVLGDQRLNIRKALYNDMLSDPNKTPATATEVVERMSDLAYRTAAGFSRVYYEFLVPYARRCLRILEDRGDIQLPVKNGRAISFRAVSPLAMAQHGRDLQSLMQDFSLRAQIYGPMAAASSYDMNELHPWLQKRFGLDERLYKPVKDVVKGVEQAAEMMAQMQAQQNGGGGGPQ